jgi:hypothetical protein
MLPKKFDSSKKVRLPDLEILKEAIRLVPHPFTIVQSTYRRKP